MRTFFNKLFSLRLYFTAFVLLCGSMSHAQTQDNSSIGVFQFVADTIDVVGLEDDVSYIVRNELRKAPQVAVINQRELEIALTRNDIEQKFSAVEAVKAATVLNLNYVIIGKVSREDQQIVAKVDVVSPIDAASVGSLKFTFNNQAQIALQANYIGERLSEVIAQHKLNAKASANKVGLDWVAEISASYSGGLVSLQWSMLDPNASFLGFNIYRANNESGPFSYIASESALNVKDSIGNEEGTYFYQVSMINDEGEEVRSDKLASVVVQAQSTSSLAAPTIVNISERVAGIALEFFPSADNISKNIVAYELLRRALGEDWQVVGGHKLIQSKNSSQSKSNAAMSIEKLSVFDTLATTIKGTVYYAIRAVSNAEKGQLTNEIEYTPATAPVLALASNASLREIQLAWPRATAGYGYKLYRRTQSADDWLLLSEIPSLDTLTYTDTNIQEEGKAFEYAISVYDEFGETAKSASLTTASKSQLAPPTQVKGVSGLAKKALITWQISKDPDVSGYSIFRAPFTADKDITLTRIGEINDPLATEFTDETVLQSGTQYYYSVASINKYNSSGPVSKAVLVTTKTPPQALENISASLLENSVELTWNLPATLDTNDATEIVLERSYDGQTFEELATIPTTDAKYVDTALLAGASLWYRAQVVDKDGLISEPKVSSAVAVDLPLLLEVPEQGLLRKISIAWKNASAPAVIKVYRGTEQQHLNEVAELVDNISGAYVDEKELIDDQAYFIKIESWLAGNKIAESEIVTSSTKNIPAPKNLLAESNLARRIKLTWDAVLDESIAHYVIFRKDMDDENSQLVSIAQIDNTQTTEFVDEMFSGVSSSQAGKGIEHGKDYEYAIASKNIYGATGFIGKTVIASSKPLPLAPTNINVVAQSSSINLSWSVSSDENLSELIVERKWPFETEFTKIASINANNTSYSDAALYPYANPEYRLSVIDSEGLQSNYAVVSDIVNVKQIALRVVQEKLLRKIQLAWGNTGENTQVVVNRRKLGESSWQALATLASNTNEFTNSEGLIDQTVYEYQLGIQTLMPASFLLGNSNTVKAATKDLPNAPSLQAQSNLVKAVKLTWQASNDADVAGYHLYKVSSKGELDKLETFSRNDTQYTDDGSFFSKLDDGTTYQYQIASFNTFNVEGLHSAVASATTKAVPAAPSGLSVSLNATGISLQWNTNAEADIVTYEVYRGSSCSRVSLLANLGKTDTSYVDTSAKPNKEYCFKIKAIDASKLESELSAGVVITTPEANE